MKDIEIGEYVRTKEDIGKVTEIFINTNCYKVKNAVNECWLEEKEIIKHSKNLIDLIEEGDYINGENVVSIIDYDYKRIVTEVAMYRGIGRGNYYIDDKDIKTILTKEQYDNNCYKVGE